MAEMAVVIGAGGGVGAALAEALRATGWSVVALGRGSVPAIDLLDERTIEASAAHVSALGVPALVIGATGFLHGAGFMPERSWRDLDGAHMAHAFAVNAIGPALLMKHFLPLLPRRGRGVFATLSARVGSIGDNRLGGWYAYRASKAALNQFVRTAAVELQRRAPEAVCVALHPGTVATTLSEPFARAGLDVRTPAVAAAELLAVINGLTARDSGGFFDHRGAVVAW